MRHLILSILVVLSCVAEISAQCTINVTCRPTPPKVECACEIPEIDSIFMDFESNGNEDIIAFEGLGFSVTSSGNCGFLRVQANDFESHPQDCTDSFYVRRVYQIVSIFGGAPQTCIDTFFTEVIPAHFYTEPSSIEISCEDNVDSIFQDYKNKLSFSEFLDCNNNVSISYEPDSNPVLANRKNCAGGQGCGAEQHVRPLLVLTGPCHNKCVGIGRDDIDRAISTFCVTDPVQSVLTCPVHLPSVDVSDPDLGAKIDSIIGEYDLFFGCDEPTVTNDFDAAVLDSIRRECNPTPLTINMVAEEECAVNSSNCSFTLDLVNNSIPEITDVPDTLFLECGDPDNELKVNDWKVLLRAKDFQGFTIPITQIQFDFDFNVLGVSNCASSYDITFTVFDDCNNFITAQSVIRIDDTQRPTLINCPPDTTVNADDPMLISAVSNWVNSFQASDNCKPDFLNTNNFDSNLLAFNCGNIDTLITFIADDTCSEPTTCSANLSIIDNVTYDFINFPNDTVIQCEAPVNTVVLSQWTGGVTGLSSLNVPFPNVQNDLDFLDPRLMSCNDVIEVTFFFDNPCGAPVERTAILEIRDEIPPTITCPTSATFSGEFDIIQPDITAWIGSAVAQDNCEATVQNTYSSILFQQDCSMDTISVDIQFWAQDNCMQSSPPCTSTLTIVSEKEPFITCPTSLVLECGSDGMLDSIESWSNKVISTNFAGADLPSTASIDFTSINLINCLETTEVVFTVEDMICDRSKTCTTSITIQDTQRPQIQCPGNLTINTTSLNADQEIADWLASVTFDDNGCTTPTLFTDPPVDDIISCDATDDITVTFTAIDMCNQERPCLAIISFNNDVPTVTCPVSDLRLECEDSNNPSLIQAWLAETTATDNDGMDLSLDLSNDFVLDSIQINCMQTLPVSFNVEDGCMQPSSCSKNIIISDSTAPVVDCPTQPLNLLAGDTVKIPKFLTWLELIPVDECNGYTITSDFDENQLAGFDCDEISYNINISVTDECGWITPCSASIDIQNNISTTFNYCDPGANNLQVECGAPDVIDEIRLWMSQVTAVDVFLNEFPTDPNLDLADPALMQCNSTIPVIFELSDLCGQAQTCSLTLTVVDTQQPTPLCPRDTAFVLEDPNFDSDISNWLALISGEDNCSVDLSYTNSYSSISALPPCEASVDQAITFTVEDDCGNQNTCNSILTIGTTAVPSISCPTNQVIECGDPDNDMIITLWLAEVSGQDANGDPLQPVFSFDRDAVDDINCSGEISILFEIQDNCNIQDSCRRSIIVEDTSPPVAQCPDPLIVNSTDPVGPQMMQDWIDSYTPTDNCSMAIGSIQNGVIVPTVLCNSDEEINIEFYAEDACGMRDTCTTTLSVNKAAPEINCGADIEIECGAPGNEQMILDWIEGFTSIDNNAKTVDVASDYTSTTLDQDCEATKIITFTATDDCGSTSNCERSIIQIDNLRPEITVCPQSVVFDIALASLDQNIDNWLSSFSAIDQCNTAEVSNDYALELGAFDCGSEQDVIFTAIDLCGNVNDNCTANISFENNLDVTIFCPAPIIVKCNSGTVLTEIQEFLSNWTVESEDEFEVTSDFEIDDINVDCIESYTQDVEFIIVDNCGNTDVCMSFIEFIPSASVYIPTIFQPSASDDENRYFAIRTNIAVEEIESFKIYSRWGDLMYDRENFDPNTEQGWDGKNKFGNHVQGVYTYAIFYTDIFGNSFESIGTITLLE